MSTDAIRTSLDQDCTPTAAKYDVIVVGSLVVDVPCHYAPLQASNTTAQPTPASSNPATIRQCTGGVAYNIALALHYLGHKPLLMSVVADDAAGDQLLNQIKTDGLSAEGILHLPSSSDVRTGQYVGSYDASKEFIFGIADVSLMELTPKLADIGTWLSLITTDLPKAIVLDLCFPSSVLTAITSLSQQHNIPLILEPFSASHASKLVQASSLINADNIFPRSPYTLITPNETELIAMHNTFTSSPLSTTLSHSRYRRIAEATALTHTLLRTSSWPADFQSLASKAIALLPFFPTIILTLAERGCLFCSLTHEDTDALPGLANKLDSVSVTTADKVVVMAA